MNIVDWLVLYILALLSIEVPYLAARRIDFSDLNLSHGGDIGLSDCLGLNSGIRFRFDFDLFFFDIHERINNIILFALCIYFIEHLSLVSFCRVKLLFRIRFLFDWILSSAELELRIFFYGFMPRNQLHKLLFEFDCLLTYFSLYFGLLFVATDKDLFLFAIRPFSFLLV